MCSTGAETRPTAKRPLGPAGLLVVVVLLGVVIVWAGSWWLQESAWRRAVAPIREVGGSVAWAAGTSRRVENAISVSLSDKEFGDDQLVALAQFPNVQMLYLTNTSVTDQDLEHLKSLKSLEWVDLRGTDITPSGALDLKNSLPKVEIGY